MNSLLADAAYDVASFQGLHESADALRYKGLAIAIINERMNVQKMLCDDQTITSICKLAGTEVSRGSCTSTLLISVIVHVWITPSIQVTYGWSRSDDQYARRT